MRRKTFALFMMIPMMLFFFTNGIVIQSKDQTIYEVGSEIPAQSHKVYYLLPDNELSIPENKEFLNGRDGQKGRKYKLRDPHKVVHKNFHRQF